MGRNNLKQFCNLWHLIHSSYLKSFSLNPRSNFQTNIQECIYCKRLWIYTVYIGKYVWLQQQAISPTHLQAANLSATCTADWVVLQSKCMNILAPGNQMVHFCKSQLFSVWFSLFIKKGRIFLPFFTFYKKGKNGLSTIQTIAINI